MSKFGFLYTDGDFYSTSSTGESLKHLVSCGCDSNSMSKLGIQDDRGSMESIWSRAVELCESSSLRNFLRKRGNMASVSFNQGTCVWNMHLSRINKLVYTCAWCSFG